MNRLGCKAALHLTFLFLLTSCQSLPELFQSAERMANNDAITVKVDQDAIKKNTDVFVDIRVLNKEVEKIKP